jgi:diaminopimelate decarboxylase
LPETRAHPVSKVRNLTTPKFNDQELFNLAEKFGTPYFLIDEGVLRKNVSEIEQAYQKFKGPFRVAYSIKANFNPAVIKTFVSEGIMFDLTASNELYFLMKCGGSAENVIYTSITETAPEYESVIKGGVRKIVVSSYNGLLNLIHATAKVGGEVNVLIRVNPEVHVKAELRFSIRHGKFGVPLDSMGEDSAMFMLKKILETPSLKFDGFHFHLGSQIEDPSCYSEALERLESFILGARRSIGDFPINTLDIGGGLPTSYGKNVPAPADFSATILEQLSSLAESFGSKFTLIVESGRYLSAESTILGAPEARVSRGSRSRRRRHKPEDCAGGQTVRLTGRVHHIQQVQARRRRGGQARPLQRGRRLLDRALFSVPLPAQAVHPHEERAGQVRRGQEGGDGRGALRGRRRRHGFGTCELAG